MFNARVLGRHGTVRVCYFRSLNSESLKLENRIEIDEIVSTFGKT